MKLSSLGMLLLLAACASNVSLDVDGKPVDFRLRTIKGERLFAGPSPVPINYKGPADVRDLLYGPAVGGPEKIVIHLSARAWNLVRTRSRSLIVLLEVPRSRTIGTISFPELQGACVFRPVPMCGTFPVAFVNHWPLIDGSIRIDRTENGTFQAHVDLEFDRKSSSLKALKALDLELGEFVLKPAENVRIRGKFAIRLE